MNSAGVKRGTSPLRLRRLTYAALYLALAMVLPFVTGQIPKFGSMLLPMHIPALLCGFLCGWKYGLAVGFIAPLLRSVIFGMPPMIPTAVAMTLELAAYGGISGLLRRALPRNAAFVYVTLLVSLVAGRAAWTLARLFLAGLALSAFSWDVFVLGAVTEAAPGILLQLLLVPVLVIAMERAGLSLNEGRKRPEDD